jgi:hypothetical protein
MPIGCKIIGERCHVLPMMTRYKTIQQWFSLHVLWIYTKEVSKLKSQAIKKVQEHPLRVEPWNLGTSYLIPDEPRAASPHRSWMFQP